MIKKSGKIQKKNKFLFRNKESEIKNIPLIDFSKFKGKEIALVEGKIVAAGKSSREVFEKAKKLFPQKSSKDIILASIPKEEVFIYLILVL